MAFFLVLLFVLFPVGTVVCMGIAMRLVAVAFAMAGTVVLVELLGAIGPLEFMALAGNGKQGNGHQKDGESFHRAASIATWQRNATPKAVEIHSRRNHAATARAARSWAPLPPSLAEVAASSVWREARFSGDSRNPRSEFETATGSAFP